MGLLDDAIREHLELKRRRGADPNEVARQEDEALGDPRSGEFARPDAAPAAPVFDDEAEPEPAPPADPDEEPWLEDEPDEPPAGQATAAFAAADVEPEVVRPDDEPAGDE